MDDRPYVLVDDKGHRHVIPAASGTVRVAELGVVNPARWEEQEGRRITIGGKAFLVLRADLMDLLSHLERGAQTIGPKDIASLLLHADVRPGARIVEGGTGTGSLTVALAAAVGTTGSVVTYDLRVTATETARENLLRTGIRTPVTFRNGDVREAIAERDVDSVFLDLPDPWNAVPSAWEALRPGGHLAAFSPNMEQVKETAAAIRKKPFVDLHTIELIERGMEVRDVGVRPSFAALGHTGYLTFARKVLDTF
ncbi:MAG TPA: tRNA (adenine-N1)-methyltransferase [Thermoplasmata archaeon]|nr:tRNA (adenine-N1)-methyltransferase [Thermoplasmata archaeon]